MKKIVYISMGLVAVLAISCSKKDSPVSTPAETAKQNLKEVSITVGAPEDIETKVAYAYDEAEKKLKLTWEDGDKITLQKGSDAYTLSTDTDNITSGGKMATFTGSVPDGEGTYDVFYAGNGENAMTLAELEAMDYSVQTQSANDNTSHLKFAARLKGVTFTPGTDDIYFTADWAKEHGNGTYQQSGAIRIRLQNPGTVTGVNCVKLIAPSEIFYKDNRLSEKTNVLTVNFGTSALQTSDDHIVAYAMLPWSDIALPEGQYEVRFEASDFDIYKKTFSVASGVKFVSTAVNSITLNKTGLNLQPFYGGTGSEEDPYLIANVRHFKNISTLAANDGSYLEANYRQVVNLQFNEVITNYMIGSSEKPFRGTYVGYNRFTRKAEQQKLLGLTINANEENSVGVFRYVTGTIDKIIITSSSSITGAETVGALVGTLLDGGTVSNCKYSSSSVTGSRKVGGLVGEAKGLAKITNCQTDDTVNSGSAIYVGGIVGYVTSAEVTNCVNMADVTGGQFVGGIAGDMEDGKIYACVNSANVTSNNTEAGGIVARIQGGTIRACYTSDGVLISGYSRIGGIAGYQSNQGKGASLIINCAAKSNIRSTNSGNNGAAGGLVGYMYSAADKGDVILTNSVALGSGIYNTWKNTAYLGAIVGQVNGAEALCYVRNCYSQHNSTTNVGAAVYYSSKSDGSTITNTKQTYMGGIYGNLVKGTVQNCYCVGADNANGNGINNNAAVGAGSKGSDGAAGNTRMVKNAVKNGTATVNPSGWTIAFSQIKPTSVTSAYLVDIMNLGTWTDSGMTVRQSYFSSEGTPEEVCEWVGLNGTSPASYDPAYPSELKQLGNKYYPN